jgi:very-short-patch-repair endonuclease
MEILLLLLVVAAIIITLVSIKPKPKTQNENWPYYPKKLLSQPEQVLYHRLVEALPDHLVFAQVQLSRLLGVKKGHDYRAWLNRINRMSADFVVCRKDGSVVAVIELDDQSHQKAERQAADAKKDRALSSAGIRLIRWQVKAMPDLEAIKAAFADATT